MGYGVDVAALGRETLRGDVLSMLGNEAFIANNFKVQTNASILRNWDFNAGRAGSVLKHVLIHQCRLGGVLAAAHCLAEELRHVPAKGGKVIC